MNESHFTANWNYPTAIRAGVGRISELADACHSLGIKAPLLVTDPGLADLPMLQQSLAACSKAGLRCGLFSRIKGNPTAKNISDGVLVFNEGKHDGVIAFGGGSALDAGKAIAFMSGQSVELWAFEDVGDNWSKAISRGIAPIVAVPTTAGTGSEVGRVAVITDEAKQLKKLIFHPKILPSIVILDPQLTVGLPSQLTAATGMDALSHNLEAYCSPSYHPMAAGVAVEGMRLIKNYLPLAVAQGDILEARMQMLVASTLGATAFQKGLGAMHALAHPLGALYDAHHGMLNAILMPYVLQANRPAIEQKIIRLALYLDLPGSFAAFLQWVLDLRQQVGIPATLAGIGINSTQAELLGSMAAEDPSAGSNPVAFTAEQYRQLFVRAVEGVL
ncbi:iron-containing alcohol dehydrogenase [Dasania marina]|uniref:iron-containing alcohol dehydrogenase n=1 Tax=Dasania marina TaxID=471499 RepID=UPI0003826A50|nr:iron-containing alcohol dehydrogenase [Dasania marina]